LSVDLPILLDVTRLIWRRWRGSIPTGVDRVCLAYVQHFRDRAQAVVQRRGVCITLSTHRSRHLFDLVLTGDKDFRRRFAAFVAIAALFGSARRPPKGALYFNVGHTGLDEPSLPGWIARHRLRAIYLVHDLIPLTHPLHCRPGEDRKHELRMRQVLASATGVIGNSQATLDDLARFATSQSLRMPPNISAWLSGRALTPLASATPEEGRPYFLVLGTIEGRKNHQLLLDVWRRLAQRLGSDAPRLVIVGARGWQAEKVLAQLDSLGPLASLVTEISGCPDDQLARLLSGARALLMPSYAEGYGLPVFEALEFGTPVIAADLPVYREVAGDIPNFLSPDDVEGWEQAISDYRADGPVRQRQLQRMKGFRVPDWAYHFAVIDRWLAGLIE
jgi:glycosyltransferase involved in cell wall biosynthesis